MLITTFAQLADATHMREVVTYQQGQALSVPIVRSIGATLPQLDDFAAFQTSPGDHLLVAFAAAASQSGNKLASDMSSVNTLADLSQGKQLHISSHTAVLGDATNNLSSVGGGATGFEHRASIVYIDRENAVVKVQSSVHDSVDPYDGSLAGAIVDASVLTGSDAALGTFDISLSMRGYEEIGAVRVMRWPQGSAPPIDIIDQALPWMWESWALQNKPRWYPPLFAYE